MRLISLFIIVIIVLLIMWFMTQNADQVIEELELFQYSYFNISLVSVLFVTFAFGVMMGFLIPVFQYLHAKAEVRKIKKELKKLRSELNELRNVGIEGELEDGMTFDEEDEIEILEDDDSEDTEDDDEE